jgi:TonB family protein
MKPRTIGNGYRGNDANFPNMIFLSLLFHVIVVALILVSVTTTSRHLTFGTAYSVQLVGSEAVLPSGNSSLLKDVLQPKAETSSIIIRRKINSIYSAPVKEQETNKANIEKALSAIRQKESARSKTSEAAHATGRPQRSDAEINAQINEYTGVVLSKVKQNWTMPQSLIPEKNITAIIDVKILRNGALEYVGFEKRSGNRYFDDSALRTIKKSSPVPPLPYWIKDNSIEISIIFPSSELR